MKWIWVARLCVVLQVGILSSAQTGSSRLKTYRSEKFGYEISYPAEMEFKAYFDGSSGELKDSDTGRTLVDFEVWPPDVCPSQPPGTIARKIGIERAKTVTQADGPVGSSYCADPVAVREFVSVNGNKIYELELTCMSETFSDPGDDEADTESSDTAVDADPIIKNEGKKGPTFFIDISQSWRKRVLMADPVGFDPRMEPIKNKIDVAALRKILQSMKAFHVERPPGICIEDLQRRPLTGVAPSPKK